MRIEDPGPIAPAGPALDASLRDAFGHESFREGQREVVESVLAGRDVLAVFPTGAGKSLLYQLPAFLLPGATIAVSPLIALMKDQLDRLVERGLPAASINSSLGLDEQDAVMDRLARGQVKLLFVAPERFRSGRFRAALERVRVSLFAVDEAHCVSEWGHDFRPDYLKLGEAARSLGRPPILAVTATATEDVRRDIVASLGLAEGHQVFVRGFDRPNLHLSVVAASGEDQKLAAVAAAIASHGAGGSVIVYCATRKSCERVAARLQRGSNARVLAYHAGLGPSERRATQEAWTAGAARVVVATNAFGLGIDKEDVRLVVHHDLPGSLEAYYQEAGRAGRDGLPSRCVLVHSGADVRLQQFLIDGSYPDRSTIESTWRALSASEGGLDPEGIRAALGPKAPHERAVAAALRILGEAGHADTDRSGSWVAADDPGEQGLAIDWARHDRLRQHEHEQLWRMQAYARGGGCRRATILRHFGAAGAVRCGACDRCEALGEDALPEDEAKVVSRKVLSLVARLKGRFGRGVVARLLAGQLKPEDADRGFGSIPTVGALKPWSVDECGAAIDECLAHGLLVTRTEDGRYPKLDLTPLGVEVLFDRKQLAVAHARPAPPAEAAPKRAKATKAAKKKAAPAPAAAAGPADQSLLEALREWRRGQSRERGLPAYCIFHDSTLAAIAAARPRDLAELLAVPGLGPAKAEKYGEGVLEVVRGHPRPHLPQGCFDA